jgi:hypothetical protein
LPVMQTPYALPSSSPAFPAKENITRFAEIKMTRRFEPLLRRSSAIGWSNPR